MKRIVFLMVSFLVLFMESHAQDFRNSSQMLIGKMEFDGIVRDNSNMRIGKVDSDGEVKDCNNMRIGRVKPDGTVVDRNNMTIGYAKGIPMTYAAVLFFFNIFR